jgi:hypothetical protein
MEGRGWDGGVLVNDLEQCRPPFGLDYTWSTGSCVPRHATASAPPKTPLHCSMPHDGVPAKPFSARSPRAFTNKGVAPYHCHQSGVAVRIRPAAPPPARRSGRELSCDESWRLLRADFEWGKPALHGFRALSQPTRPELVSRVRSDPSFMVIRPSRESKRRWTRCWKATRATSQLPLNEHGWALNAF